MQIQLQGAVNFQTQGLKLPGFWPEICLNQLSSLLAIVTSLPLTRKKALHSSAAEVSLFLPPETARCFFFVSVSKRKEGNGEQLANGIACVPRCGVDVTSVTFQLFSSASCKLQFEILPRIPVLNLVHGKNVNYIFITNFRTQGVYV